MGRRCDMVLPLHDNLVRAVLVLSGYLFDIECRLKDDLNEPYFTSIKNAMSRKATPEPT